MFRLKKKQKRPLNEPEIHALVQKELDGYIKREDLQDYLKKIERDEKKKRIWDGLSTRKKIKLLKYALSRKGGKDGKK